MNPSIIKRLPLGFLMMVFLLGSIFAKGQISSMGPHENIDSLRLLLSKDVEDTHKVIHLYSLARELSNSHTDTSLILSLQALQLAQQLQWKKGEAFSYILLGWCGELSGNFPGALANYYKAVRIGEQLTNKSIISISLGLIGDVYTEQGDYAKAISFYTQSLNMDKAMNNSWGVARNIGLIGSVYREQHDYDKALNHYFEALNLCQRIGNSNGSAVWTSYIGSVYKQQGDYEKALVYCFKSLGMFEQSGNKNHIAEDLCNIGSVYTSDHKYQASYDYLYRSLNLSLQIGALQHVKNAYEALSLLYEKSTVPLPDSPGNKISSIENMRLRALHYHKRFLAIRDTIFGQQRQKQILNMEFERKQDALRFEQERKNIRQRNIRNTILATLGIALVFLVIVYRQRNKIANERSRSDGLLLNILPHEVAEELKEKGKTEARLFNHVTVLFTDFKGFTVLAEQLSASELVAKINDYFSSFDTIMQRYGIEKIKTIGDSYMAVGGLPVPNQNHAGDVVQAALAIQEFMQSYAEEKRKSGELFFDIRIGIHSGPVIAGIVGTQKFAYDIWGDTVNTASRMESSGEVQKINISAATYELIKNDFRCSYRGSIEVKGKGKMDMYFVEGRV